MKLIQVMSLAMLAVLPACQSAGPKRAGRNMSADGEAQIASYAELVYRNYRDAHADAVKLQSAIDAFLANPTDATLSNAKKAWLHSRDSYGQTEAFRFYEGPIDFANADTGEEGPEGLINAWPLNEAYIDYVKGNPKAGIVQMTSVQITTDLLVEKNAADDEANVTTGYHAIEFLLWGQDFSADGPGNRPATDFTPGTAVNDRRRTYLKTATDLLVQHLEGLVQAWAPDQDNYRTAFLKMDRQEALGKLLSGLATLSGFELASERISVALDSGEQEDEHSCFSDNTHADFIANAQGIYNVYFGQYGDYRGQGINSLVSQIAPDLNRKLEAQLKTTQRLVEQLDKPIDRTLATPKGSPQRQKMEAVVKSLQIQAELLRDLSKPLGVEVIIAAE